MHVCLGGRIGAVDKKETKKPQEAPVVEEEAYEFVDYKDRKEALAKKESTEMDVDLGLENAAPGLIIRKRKQVEETDKVKPGNLVSVESSSAGVDIAAEDAVALLLRHSRGVQAMDDEVMHSGEGDKRADKGKKGKKKMKKVVGPERPSFLDGETDYESWVPPQVHHIIRVIDSWLSYRLTFRRAFRHPLNGDREINFNPSRDIEELECLLADDPVPVPKVFDDPLGNSDSMSRSSKTSDLFEELIAEIGLDDSIPIRIDDRYYDSEGDILYFEQLLNEDTSSDVSLTLLPTQSSSLVLPLPDPRQVCLREVEDLIHSSP
ncbi:hypothetical protein Tco_0829721 [Tanacetum coccineum]